MLVRYFKYALWLVLLIVGSIGLYFADVIPMQLAGNTDLPNPNQVVDITKVAVTTIYITACIAVIILAIVWYIYDRQRGPNPIVPRTYSFDVFYRVGDWLAASWAKICLFIVWPGILIVLLSINRGAGGTGKFVGIFFLSILIAAAFALISWILMSKLTRSTSP
jgi:hypothetical protein